MKQSCQSHHREPRSAVVIRHTEAAVRARVLVIDKFSIEVAERYFAETAEPERVTKLRNPAEARNADHNAQIIRRYYNRGLRTFPADLEEAWVERLPEPFRSECQRELTRRYGFLAARAPTGASALHSLADLVRDFGETVEALAPVLADGRIDSADQPHLRKALKESTDLQAAIVSLQQQLTDALPDPGQEATNVSNMRRG